MAIKRFENPLQQDNFLMISTFRTGMEMICHSSVNQPYLTILRRKAQPYENLIENVLNKEKRIQRTL